MGYNRRSKNINHILYVEDDLSLTDDLKYILEMGGYTVDIARTVSEKCD